MRYLTFIFIIASIMLVNINNAFSAFINWTDWQSEVPDTSVSGLIGSNVVTYTGDYNFAQLGTGTNYWTEVAEPPPGPAYTGSSVVDNLPLASELITLNDETANTITFTTAVLNPVMAIISLGSDDFGVDVDYAFDQPFTLLSYGEGFYGGTASQSIDGNTLTGQEFNGIIQFDGLISSISWDNINFEDWHGFTVGVPGDPIPEPITMLLFGTGLAGIAGVSLRRKKK